MGIHSDRVLVLLPHRTYDATATPIKPGEAPGGGPAAAHYLAWLSK
jgi:hypothetical protein